MKNEEASILEVIRNFGKEIHLSPFQLESLGLDSSFEKDLGLDSLARMELISQVENHFKVSLPEDIFASVETPRDLLRAIHKGGKKTKISKGAELVREVSDSFPGEWATLIDVLEWHIKKHPDAPHIKICLDDGEEQIITFKELKEESGKIANALINDFGVQKGKTIALMLPMGKDYFYSFIGVIMAGAIPIPMYPPYNLRQVQTHILRHCNVLENCKAFMLITVEEAMPITEILKSRVESLEKVATPKELFEEAKDSLENGPRPDPTDTAFIQYTSGSTGTPKGVILSHANLLANIKAMGEAMEVSSKDVFVSWLPLYHDMGLIGAWFGSLYFSSLLVIMSPLSFLAHPIRWLKIIQENKGTLTAAPNFAYELCLKRIKDEELKDLDLSSLRVMFNGAEKVAASTLSNFNKRFSPFGFNEKKMMPVYGLAENSLGLTFPALGRSPIVDTIEREKFMNKGIAVPAIGKKTPLEFVSCGQALENFQIRIVDLDGAELPDRRAGQIQFQGPSATSGYYRNQKATKSLFDGDWLNTGDLGYLADGELFITGRIKDIIIHAGRNIYPEEIEQGIGEIEGIRKGCVAVFGSFEPTKGTERLVVVAETRETDSKVLEGLKKKINERVVDLVGSPPEVSILAPPHSVLKTLNGKLRRSATRELFEQGNIGKGGSFIWMLNAQLLLGSLFKKISILSSRLIENFYAIYFWGLIAIVIPPSLLLFLLIPFEGIRWSFGRFVLRVLFLCLGIKILVKGSENLKTPTILISNHASYLDGFVLAMALPLKFSFVAKAELKANFFFRLILNRLNTQFVERFDIKKGTEDIHQIISDLPKDHSLLFFPEGTFIRKPGVLPFRMGAFVLASETNYPIVPISLRGTRAILPGDIWFPRRGVVRITIGNPILLTDKEKGWLLANELKDLARKEILQHCGEPDLAHEKSPLLKMKH